MICMAMVAGYLSVVVCDDFARPPEMDGCLRLTAEQWEPLLKQPSLLRWRSVGENVECLVRWAQP